MAIGGSGKVAHPSRNSLLRKKLHKQQAARRMLVEGLEGRQLMTVGPMIMGIQPNDGSVITDGQVRHVAPSELLFRFDDRVDLDADTLSGIRLIRAGDDGAFERASMATDLGSNGQVLVEFYSTQPGSVGNGIQIQFTQASRTDTRAPVVRVSGQTVQVEVNSNPLFETRVEDLMRAFDATQPNVATNLVYGLRLRGSTTLAIGRTVNTQSPLVLSGANSAKATTDFGAGANLLVRLSAQESGAAGIGLQVNVTSRDRGGPGTPLVSVSGKVVSVELNSNVRYASTAADFIAAINGDASASKLVQANLISGASATRIGTLPVSYSPLTLGGVTDIEITPAYVGLGDTNREVVMRFAQALPDDKYRIEILGRGSRALLNVNGQPFNGGVDQAVAFELDLGAQIESVVPQPVERDAQGKLVPGYNRIDVYFNNDDLINPGSLRTVNGLTMDQLRVERPVLFFQSSDVIVDQTGAVITPDVLSPQFYQLYHLAGTLTNVDDTRILPSAIRYFPDADRVALTFSRPLDALVDPVTSAPLGRGELRLRIGTNEAKPLPPVAVTPAVDAGDTFATANNLNAVWTPGVTGSQSVQINAEVRNTTPYVLDFPGGSDEIGGRQNRMQDHFRRQLLTSNLVTADAADGTTQVFYNFQSQLGRYSTSTLLNAITEQQKTRAREVLSLYERHLGIRFIETENLGLTIAVGDMRSVTPFPETAGRLLGITYLNAPGGEYLLSGELSTGQLATVLDSQDFGDSVSNNFGGAFSRAVMQGIGNLLGLGNSDDLAGFTTQAFSAVQTPGVGSEIVLPGDAEIVHGQYLYRPDSKDIDLYQFRLPVAGKLSIEAFAERMSQASLLDTQLRLYQQQTSGKWEEIAANDDYFSSDSFVQLELGAGNYIVGVSASGNNQYDPNIGDSGLGGRSQGNYQLRMDFRPPAGAVLRDATGTPLDGDADGKAGGVFDFWFRPAGAANTKFVDKLAATGGNGSAATPFKTISAALTAAVPGDVVRIVGNGGTDGKLNTVGDNLAYEIGFDSLGRGLADGTTLDVPKDVSVLVDAGAILKLRRARVGVGSTSASVDRSAGSLMVLGTPVLVDSTGAVMKDPSGMPSSGNVVFTSISDSSIGKPTTAYLSSTTPQAGDWGGLDFRHRIDSSDALRKNYERLGQFLNWVSHADLRYGGGQVVVDGVSQVVTPIQMIDARPAVVFSNITTSADAGMSASANSFVESNFHSPDDQRGGAFTADYDRVGPEIHGNTLTGNTINGLMVRARTSGGTVESMTVAGRFDDVDIVHFLPENLQIVGTPGGPVVDANVPPTTIVTLTAQAGGTLAAGTYNYRLTYVDANGTESVASEATQSVTVAAGSSIVLQNLPPVRTGTAYVGRRLYRSDATGSGNYVLVRELNASSTTLIDTGSSLGVPLSTSAVVTLRSRLDARLAIDPGTVVKLQGSRIDVQFGAQLIAEGSSDHPIVFTSVDDVRYGAGGTFATSSAAKSPVAGSWGGLYVGPTSSASIDHAVVAYGGGTTRIEGGFADFNAIEIQQGDARLTHSRLENNAAGSLGNAATADRGGRGTNGNAVMFVRGAQPVIVGNELANNTAAGFSFNVSALNSQLVTDSGRSTGYLDRASQRLDNRGPLVSDNRFSANAVNGLVVRGGTLTTEGVWDDTDIVHVVKDRIDVPNFHTYGGLRLQSSPTQSLVVKLLSESGSVAGLTATGTELDNADRIGGSVQLIGTPGNPVIMTSLYDCTVGVGFTPDGRPQTDTLSLGACQSQALVAPFADIVVVMDDSASMGFAQTFSAQLMQDIDNALQAAGLGSTPAGSNQFGLVAYGGFNTSSTPAGIPLGANNSLFGTSQQYATAVTQLQASGAVEDGYLAMDYALDTYQFRAQAEKFIILVTNEDRDIVDPTKTYASVKAKLQAKDVKLEGIVTADIYDSQRNVALALDAQSNAFVANGTGGYIVSPNGTVIDRSPFDTTVPDYVNLIRDIGGVAGDIDQIQAGGLVTTSFSNVLVDSVLNQAGVSRFLPDPGNWNSVLLDQNSNDRNVAVVSELESSSALSPGSNGTPESSEYLGELAADLKTSDENRRLGYQIHGVISEPGDTDIYSFRGVAGSEVWLDIDRTLNSLDTVVELVDANGRILALSDNSLAEEANPSLLYAASDMPAQSVHSLRKSTPELYLKSATGAPKDLYSTNPRDAGLRVVLPGEPGSNVLYHVRVRSSNLRAGDAASRLLDPSLVNAGVTRGAYQLQVRLRETDEIPGSSVTYADIRYATNGIEVVGLPRHSQLLGEIAETPNNNDTFANAQAIGNLLTTDKQALSIAGSLNSLTDVDWYGFSINNTAIRPTQLREYFATVFDTDYADGIGRPDVSIYLFDATGRLVLSGLGSNLVDDQAGGLPGAGSYDLSRGSSGGLDPFIGSSELPAGQYFLAVTNSDNVPRSMVAYTSATVSGATAAMRLQPINGLQLIAEDHIGSTGGSTAVPPKTPVLFPTGNSAVPLNLSDVSLYVSQTTGLNQTDVQMVNPFTGQVANTVGRFGLDVQDIAFRYNGGLRAYDWSPQPVNINVDQDTLMDYIDIDTGTGAATDVGDLNISTFHIDGTNAADSNDGMYPNAITFASIGGQERGFIVASRGIAFPRTNVGTSRPGVNYTENIIYEFDENSGAATSAPGVDKTGIATGFNAGTAVLEHGYIETTTRGAPSTGLIATEATRVTSSGVTQSLIRDGNSFTLLDSASFSAVFEFDSGPEVLVNYDPANGLTVRDGMQFKLDGTVYEFDSIQGTPGVTPGTIAIPVDEMGTYQQLVDTIARHVVGGVVVTSEGNRMTFSGALIGDFTQLQNQGVFFDQGSSGNVSPGAIRVPFLATDSANDIAARMVIAINTSGIPGLTAVASGPQVTLTGGTVVTAGPLKVAGAPGGTITGAAVINGDMYAVSDAGGLFVVNNPGRIRTGNVGTYVSTSYELLGIQFAGLSAGPVHLQGGAYAQTLFGIDTSGVLYAFDTSGHLLPVFAGGASSVSTGVVGANGLAFSTLDHNLWHVSGNRSGDPGHGLPATPDGSTGSNGSGGSSLYFGFESPAANGVNYSTVTDPGNRNNYNFPGGAAGAVESQPFDLSGLSAADLPTLYFTYNFSTEDANQALPLGPNTSTNYMRDALRVYAAGEDGKWVLLATNNSARGGGSLDDEFDPLLTGNANVQELFDNNGQWRQARIPLDIFAGQANVKLRVEFSSAGGMGFGLQGGKGPQLQMLPGDRLVDGQTVTIGGRNFEIEMGPSLTLPAGSSLTDGTSVTIEGVTYVFTDGSGLPVVAPNVAVAFTSGDSAETVAAALLTAIQSATRPQASSNLTVTEPSETLASAVRGTVTGDSAIVTISGTIGDNAGLADPTSDVDLVRMDLARGSTVVARVRAQSIGSTLDSYLRIFDSQGRQLAANDNSFGSNDSLIRFTVPTDGTYYFGVSGSGNGSYNPSVQGTASGGSVGAYQLVLDVTRLLNAIQSGSRLQLEGAAHVSLPAGSPILLQGSLGSKGAPVYVNVGMTASQVGAAFQTALALSYADGNTSGFPLRGDVLDLTGLVQYDSFDFLTGLPAPSLNQLDPGPFGASTGFVGDRFSAWNNRAAALGARNNNFEGVYIDDFVIGLAGLGELAANAPAGDTTFIQDPQQSQHAPALGNPEILVGPYQVEIRGGAEYGVPLLNTGSTTLRLDSARLLEERQARGVSIRFNGSSGFSAGSTFTVSDGTRMLTFEMDNIDDSIGTKPGNVPVLFSNAALNPATNTFGSESAQTIAARFRDIINSSAVQSVLDLQAILLNSDATGATSDTVVLIGQANVNVPTSIGTTIVSQGKGDANREREQGQVVIKSARISNSSGLGIRIASGGRDANGTPEIGSPRNLLTLNTDKLIPGTVVMNSELYGNLGGGVSISGEPQAAGVPAPVPYARLINNSIVGNARSQAGSAGILVANNASPTLINNVVANHPVGLSIDATSTSTVVGGMVYHRNTANVAGSAALGQFPLNVDSSVDIFVDVANGNLYPAAKSPIIDSSIDSLQDRLSLASVKNSVGIGASAILAPQYDINGLLRVDDPTVASPTGLGESVFKDRGAADRADYVGPSVVLLNPVDNDVAGLDRNPATSVVELTKFTAEYFDIQLYDGLEPSDPNRGSDVDDSSVSSASVLLYRDNVPLVEGIDYRFGYDATTNVIRLTPLAGIFPIGSVYQIRFINAQQYGVTALAGSAYTDGAVINVVDSTNKQTTFEVDTGYRMSVPSANGTTADVVDGGVFTLDDGVRRLSFEFDSNNAVSPLNVAIVIPVGATPTQVAQAIQTAIKQAAMQFTVTDLGSGQLQLDGSPISSFLVGNSLLTVAGKPGVRTDFGIQIPLQAGRPINLVDGETFSIQRTSVPVIFELDNNGVVTPGRIAVRFTNGSTAAALGQALVSAITNAGLGLTPTYVGNGLVSLGGDAATVLSVVNTQLLQSGTAGMPAARAIKISAAASQDETASATQIAAAINTANLPGVTASAFGASVVILGATSVTGNQATIINPIKDKAGNLLKANQVNGTTTLTIFLGEGLDYGDAADPTYASLKANNGPRHVVVPGLSLGPDVRPDADAKLIDADEFDDGVTFTQALVAGFQSSLNVEVNRPAGSNAYLSAWIDTNGDGVFSAGERIASALAISSQFTTLSFIVPGGSKVGNTYARFRLSSDANSIAAPTGQAPDGEVEDYQVSIVGNPYQNPVNNMDVNADGYVSPIDPLQLINYLNDPSKPKTLTLPPTFARPPFVDVNGDGYVTNLDALIVINYLNTIPPTGSSEGEGDADGSDTQTVLTGDWMNGLVTGFVAPAIEKSQDDPNEPEVMATDAFFADGDDSDTPFIAYAVGGPETQRTLDMVLRDLDPMASETVDVVAQSRAATSLMQRLASRFRR